jgi:hypothetical protein
MHQAISHENGASTTLVESRNSQKPVYAEEYPAWNEPGQFLSMARNEALTGNVKLRAEDKTARAIGKFKQIADKVEQAVKKVRV